MPPMTDSDKAVTREIVREVLAEAGPTIAREAAWEVIKEHIGTCPVKTQIALEAKDGTIARLKIAIVLVAVSLSGGAGGGLILKLLKFIQGVPL